MSPRAARVLSPPNRRPAPPQSTTAVTAAPHGRRSRAEVTGSIVRVPWAAGRGRRLIEIRRSPTGRRHGARTTHLPQGERRRRRRAGAGRPVRGLVAGPAGAAGSAAMRGLRPVPDLRDGKVRLHLPDGFAYRSFHDTESPVTLDDGTALPGRHDGMGAFRPRAPARQGQAPARRHRGARPQPRGQQPRSGLRPGRGPHLRPDGARRLHGQRGHPARRGRRTPTPASTAR